MSAKRPMTRNQSVVLAILQGSEMPLTAYQILDAEPSRDAGLKAPLSVYRALDSLVDRGLVHRIERLNAFVACDHGPHASPAVFMICKTCKRTIEATAESLRAALEAVAKRQSFAVDAISIEMSGRCGTCAQ